MPGTAVYGLRESFGIGARGMVVLRGNRAAGNQVVGAFAEDWHEVLHGGAPQ
jgi:hypothetical protein